MLETKLDEPRSKSGREIAERDGQKLPPWPVSILRFLLCLIVVLAAVVAAVSAVNGTIAPTACICLTVALAGLAASYGPGRQ